MTRRASAGDAASRSRSTAIAEHGLAAVSVVSVCAAGESRVYDLTISGVHEFFANGLLVHNSLDTLGYLLITVFPVMGTPAAAKTTPPRGGARKPTYSKSEFG